MRVQSFDLSPGDLIADKYRVLSLLGSGWEGEVYKIAELRTGIERAAKFFFPERNKGRRASRFYARKLHKLRNCPILIHYHTEDTFRFGDTPITVLVSEFVEGEILSAFLARQPGRRLPHFQAVHLLYALCAGMEDIHMMDEYHGDLHVDNIIVNFSGLGFEIKLLDLFHWPSSKNSNQRSDLCDLVYIFYKVLGGQRVYRRHPDCIKNICSGLKHTLILKKFRNLTRLREHLETMAWE